MKKKIGLLLLSMSICCCLMSCTIGKTKVVWTGGFATDQIFKMEDGFCTLGEANILMANYKNLYFKAYSNELWERSEVVTEYTLEAYIKDVALSQMAKMMCMNLLAQEQKVFLTKNEQESVLKVSNEYFASLTKDEILELDITKESVISLYEKFALATKLYTELTDGVNEEVSDNDGRVMQVLQIVVSSQEKADKVAQRLSESEDFESAANLYNEKQTIELYVTRKDVPKEVEELIFQMDDNQVSECIFVNNQYCFYKIVNKFDKFKTDENKLIIVDERAKEAFDNVYDQYSKKIKTDFNRLMWESIRADFSKNVKTDNFFELFEKHFGDFRK